MEDFVTFEIAKKLKEKGFTCDYPFAMYNKYEEFCPLYSSDKFYFGIDDFDKHAYIAPTISQVLKWLRKEKKIFITINIGYCHENYEPLSTNPTMKPTTTKRHYVFEGYYFDIWTLYNFNNKNVSFEYFESPELAAIAGIEYVLENLI